MKNKSFLDELWDLIKRKWKELSKKEKKYKEICNNLSFEKKEEYRDLMKKTYIPINWFWLILPFKVMFYLAIFGIVVWIGFDINLLEPFKLIVKLLFKMYIFFVLIFFMEMVVSSVQYTKRSREVLDYLK